MLRHDEPIDPMAAAEIRVLSDDDSGAVARGRGIGTDLMHAAEKRCAPATAVRLRVGLDNPGARRLYERLGYAGTGELQTTTYEFRDADGHLRSATETDEWMEKRLAGPL
ncbi:GNAT family N-acetyltransferase [Brachybacterium sp. 107]|uniref:GNAT family N-acetyltransferase n=1 Tax=Brachybacterium sp. 107 TaxID=3457736 RepID=UPI00403353D6